MGKELEELNKIADKEIEESKQLNNEADEFLKRTEGLFD